MNLITHGELVEFISELYRRLGAPEDIAEAMASSLVAADLRGHHSHGIRLTPTYRDRIQEELLVPDATPIIKHETTTSAIIDGDWAFGQVVGRLAVATGTAKAKESGVATIGIRNATHLGRIGEWAERTAESDLVFVSFVCNPASEFVAPPGSEDGRLSTNPITIGVPSFGATAFPVVLDIATSQVAFGKIRQYAAQNRPLPAEWATEYEGYPDPGQFTDGGGALLPLGGRTSGYKGFGLAVMAELLAAIFGDGHVSGQSDARWGNEAVFFFVDPCRFTTTGAIRERIRAMRGWIRSTWSAGSVNIGEAAQGETYLLPGESEYRTLCEHLVSGVPIPDRDVAKLRALAIEHGLSDQLPRPLQAK